MRNMQPHALTPADWCDVIALPDVREAWGLDDTTTAADFAASVYAAKFHFVSGGPGYVGDLFILHGDALTDAPPMVLTRNGTGALEVLDNTHDHAESSGAPALS